MNETILRRIRGWLGQPANKSAPEASRKRVEFQLMYKDFPIGVLAFQNSIWEWKYSEEFRGQNELVPLIEFPNVNDVYQTGELWPFFATRAPSLKRPDILEIVEREHIDKNSEVAMLRRFGQRTIVNPFELVGS